MVLGAGDMHPYAGSSAWGEQTGGKCVDLQSMIFFFIYIYICVFRIQSFLRFHAIIVGGI